MIHRFLWKRAFGMAAVIAATSVGCGGQPKQAESPPNPSLADDDSSQGGGPVAPASSQKVQQGIDAIQAGDFAKAKAVLSEATEADPKDPQAAFYLGVALEGGGDTQGAMAQYKKALELDPKLVEAQENLSAVQLDSGDAAGALSTAEAGLKTNPKSAPLLINRAMALASLGKGKDAVSAFEDATKVAPDNVELRYQYAEALAESGDHDRAVAELKKVAETDKLEVLASAGRLFGKLKAFDQCIAALDKAIGKKDNAELHVQRGLCKHENKDDKGAQADYEAAIKIDDKFAPAHFYLGEHFKAHGDKKGAKKELSRAVELDPNGGVGKAAKKSMQEL